MDILASIYPYCTVENMVLGWFVIGGILCAIVAMK
jgi:hypothetical protein